MKKEKVCPHCNTLKPAKEFYTSGVSLSQFCKVCTREMTKYQTPSAIRKRRNQELLKDGKRICSCCNKTLDISEFRKRTDGFYSAKCKECMKGMRC